MKAVVAILVTLATLAALASTQQGHLQGVYTPYTFEEVTTATTEQVEPVMPDGPHHRPHPKKHKKDNRYGGYHDEEVTGEPEEFVYEDDLTDEEREERRQERRRYNKIFRVGMIVGTGVLAVIIFKFCKAKRLRNRQRMMQQNPMVIQQQPYINSLHQPVPVHPHAFPSAPLQPVQMGRPYREPVQAPTTAPIVRGRVHDSFIRQENPVDAQIRFHEAQIARLQQMKECSREREIEMQRVPINTTESFESHQPINRYRNMPVGQPVYPKDSNSSFASEYPEI